MRGQRKEAAQSFKTRITNRAKYPVHRFPLSPRHHCQNRLVRLAKKRSKISPNRSPVTVARAPATVCTVPPKSAHSTQIAATTGKKWSYFDKNWKNNHFFAQNALSRLYMGIEKFTLTDGKEKHEQK
jgi:hypothetical protein